MHVLSIYIQSKNIPPWIVMIRPKFILNILYLFWQIFILLVFK